MSRYLRATVRGLLGPFRAASRRPRAAAAVVLLEVLLIAPAAVWASARYQWLAAREAVAADRAQEIGRAHV